MLTDRTVKNAKPRRRPYKLYDERGLFLLVQPNGARWWRLTYRFGKKRKTISLGVFDEVSLAKARTDRDDWARDLLRRGLDPSAERRRAKTADVGSTFREVAAEWIAKQKKSSADDTTTKRQWLCDDYLFPKLGNVPIRSIDPPMLLAALRPIEGNGLHETAHRARTLAGQILRYAIATGKADRDSSADLRGALTPVTTTHHAAITEPKEIGRLLNAIDADAGGSDIVRLALQFEALVFVRSAEQRGAMWTEFDETAKLWRIPGSRMKMGLPHLVPLAKQTLAILAELRKLTGRGRYVFAAIRGKNRPMSENTLNAALARLGYRPDQMTPHGFRTTASTRLHELGFESDWVEMQLAHLTGGVRGVYNQAKYLPGRTTMMQAYADHLDELRALAAKT